MPRLWVVCALGDLNFFIGSVPSFFKMSDWEGTNGAGLALEICYLYVCGCLITAAITDV